MGRGQVGLSLKRKHHMKYKNISLAVLFSTTLAVAVQDFGVPPGIPNVFSAGEVAVADDVNENFEWVENALDTLDLVDEFQDDRIDDIEDATKLRTQSLAALGYFSSGSLGPLPKGDTDKALLGGPSPGYLGWLDIPLPQDWDSSTTMTVSVNMLNFVDFAGQTGQDIEVDVYGDLIFDGEPAFNLDDGPFCEPGPICGFDLYSNCFISVPTVQPSNPLLTASIGGPSTPSGDPYMVNATFTFGQTPLTVGGQAPRHIRINFFEPSNPLIVGQKGGGKGGGGTDPVIYFAGPTDLSPVLPPSFVYLEYTAL